MSIRPIRPTEISHSESSVIRAGHEVDAPASAGAGRKAAQPARDRVELSAEGRALARAGALDASRVDSIRGRVLQGAYDSLSVVDTVARRMLQRGDL